MRIPARAVVVALTAVAGVAGASVVIPLSIEQLAQKAEVVVRGRVTAQHADWTRGGRIVTTTTLAVTEALKGQPDAQVEVRSLGGSVGGVGQQVAGEVHFASGEEVVVFLRPTGLQGGSYAVVGMAQGKFAVSTRAQGPVATQSLEGLGFVDEPGQPVVERAAEPLPLADLSARIRRAVAK